MYIESKLKAYRHILDREGFKCRPINANLMTNLMITKKLVNASATHNINFNFMIELKKALGGI